MNKTIEPYETENFIIHYTDAANLIISAAKYTLLKNREVVEKLGLIFEKEDEEMHFLIADKNFGLVNSFLTKETFKWLENQKQFEKINVIMPNPFGEYSFMVEQLSEDMKDLRKQAKQYQTWIKVKKRESSTSMENISSLMDNYLESLPRYEFHRNRAIMSAMNGEIPREEAMSYAMTATGIEHFMTDRTIDEIIKRMKMAHYRMEIDFINKKVRKYKLYSEMSVSSPRDFKPWEKEAEEVFVEEKTFQQYKIEMFKSISNLKMLEAKNQLIEENDLKMKEEFRLSDGWAANMDKCPIKQFSHLGFDSIEKGIESKVLFMMGYLLTNNLITKEVEKVRVLKKTGSSKKKNKGSNNYKSIIKERYVYKECTEEDEKLFDEFKEIEEATEEKTPAEEMTKVGIEKEENDDILEFAAKIGIEKTMVENKSDGLNTNYEYEKEEWIVRPHTRTLKDGRKIVISGQRRKRRNELLTKSEENENKARKTFGITSRDIEKLNKNSMRK